MLASDFQGFETLMKMQIAYYRAKDISDTMIVMYFDDLADFSAAEIESAFRNHRQQPETGRFFPRVSDLIALLQGGTKTRGVAAWDEAIRAISRVGSYESPDFSDPLIRSCIDRMGGWPNFCAMSDDWTDEDGTFHKGDKEFKRLQFVERYQSYLRNPPSDAPARILGRHEIANRTSQYADDPRALASGRPILAPPAFRELDEGLREQVRAALSAPELRESTGGMSAIGATARKALERVNTEWLVPTEAQAEAANEARRRAREAAEALTGERAEAGR